MDDIDEVVAEFLVESHENLDQLDRDLVELERRPGDRAVLSSIFRTIHTIKGTCGFLGFDRLQALTHAGESLLSRLRDGSLSLDGTITDALLAMFDGVRQMLRAIEGSGTDGDEPYSDLIAVLSALHEGDSAGVAAYQAAVAAATPAPVEAPAFEVPAVVASSVVAPVVVAPVVAAPPAHPEPPRGVPTLGQVLVEMGVVDAEQVSLALAAQGLGDKRLLGEILVEEGIVQAEAIEDALALHSAGRSNDGRSKLSDANVRVDVALLDRLMTLVGELVLARNNILVHTGQVADPAVLAASQRLDLVTGELQEAVLKTRMQPIRTAWARFPRVVRDLAQQCGKQVRFETEGDDTELDRTLIEAIKDPLTHLVRNAVDHGIEAPAARQARGKNAHGVLRMRAHHEGGQVVIEISDDGGGIDVDGVKAKAVTRGLLTAGQAVQLSDSDACQLVFAPGFSTAEQVTNMSGRGVGMDVVKTNIEKIGGTVDLRSRPGTGTTICVKIPLTLAILSALVVRCDGQRYAIPQLDVVELVWLDGSSAGAVEWLHDVPVYRLRGRLLPLLSLREQLGLAPDPDLTTTTIVVLAADDRQFGLVVDSVITTEEIVVKPLGQLLHSVPTYSGATIMGDGSVALILDAAQLAQRAGLATTTGRTAPPEPVVETATTELRSVLVVACGDDARVALALDAVARLEEMPRAALELSDGQPVIQYRGCILPLVELGPLLGRGGSAGHGDVLTVVVHHVAGSDVGLVVDRIVDIVEVAVAPDDLARGCTLVVRDRVTDLIPVIGLLAAAVGWSVPRDEVLAR